MIPIATHQNNIMQCSHGIPYGENFLTGGQLLLFPGHSWEVREGSRKGKAERVKLYISEPSTGTLLLQKMVEHYCGNI